MARRLRLMEVRFPESFNIKRLTFFDVEIPLRKWNHNRIFIEFSYDDLSDIAFDLFYPENFITIKQQLKIQ